MLPHEKNVKFWLALHFSCTVLVDIILKLMATVSGDNITGNGGENI